MTLHLGFLEHIPWAALTHAHAARSHHALVIRMRAPREEQRPHVEVSPRTRIVERIRADPVDPWSASTAPVSWGRSLLRGDAAADMHPGSTRGAEVPASRRPGSNVCAEFPLQCEGT
jgi:hypothetical protein